MGQANQKIQSELANPASFAVVPPASDPKRGQTTAVVAEETNTRGFRFAMKVWVGVFLIFWALLLWDLIYALIKLW